MNIDSFYEIKKKQSIYFAQTTKNVTSFYIAMFFVIIFINVKMLNVYIMFVYICKNSRRT